MEINYHRSTSKYGAGLGCITSSLDWMPVLFRPGLTPPSASNRLYRCIAALCYAVYIGLANFSTTLVAIRSTVEKSADKGLKKGWKLRRNAMHVVHKIHVLWVLHDTLPLLSSYLLFKQCLLRTTSILSSIYQHSCFHIEAVILSNLSRNHIIL